MSDTVKLNRMEVAPDAWIHSAESTEFRALVDAKRTLPGDSWMPGKCQSATLQLSARPHRLWHSLSDRYDGMRDRRPLSTAARSSWRQSGVAICATGALTTRRGAKTKIWTRLNNVSALR